MGPEVGLTNTCSRLYVSGHKLRNKLENMKKEGNANIVCANGGFTNCLFMVLSVWAHTSAQGENPKTTRGQRYYKSLFRILNVWAQTSAQGEDPKPQGANVKTLCANGGFTNVFHSFGCLGTHVST